MSYPNALVSMCLPYEERISVAYRSEIQRMMRPDGTRNEFEWGVWCDQDQLYYATYEVVPRLEERHDAMDDSHNQFTQWLNALFEVQAARLGFDGDV